jgi:hypothetical protein
MRHREYPAALASVTLLARAVSGESVSVTVS